MPVNSKKNQYDSADCGKHPFLVVMPDEVVEAMRKEKARKDAFDEDMDSSEFTKYIKYILSLIMFSNPFAISFFSLKIILETWLKAKQSGINVFPISRSEARSLRFTPGHPRDGMLYGLDPNLPKTYHTIASFHRMVFEHKVAEAIEILTSLGATHLKVEHICGWSREFEGIFSGTVPQGSGHAAGGASNGRNDSLLFEATYRGNSRPFIPESLYWYAHEPTWRTIARGRIDHGMTEFSLMVNYEDDFGVNATLRADALKAGLELGGNFVDHKTTSWKLYGKFAAAD